MFLNLIVNHQTFDAFKKSKAEVWADWLAGEGWAPWNSWGHCGRGKQKKDLRVRTPQAVWVSPREGRGGLTASETENRTWTFKTGVTALSFIQEAKYTPSPL